MLSEIITIIDLATVSPAQSKLLLLSLKLEGFQLTSDSDSFVKLPVRRAAGLAEVLVSLGPAAAHQQPPLYSQPGLI